jgi:hypothetical protein
MDTQKPFEIFIAPVIDQLNIPLISVNNKNPHIFSMTLHRALELTELVC